MPLLWPAINGLVIIILGQIKRGAFPTPGLLPFLDSNDARVIVWWKRLVFLDKLESHGSGANVLGYTNT